MSIIDPLKVGIKATDGLIDEIVYRLYGLTEEEIKVVECTALIWRYIRLFIQEFNSVISAQAGIQNIEF